MNLHFRRLALLLLPLALFLSGCYTVPVTGRSALSLVDDKEVTKMSIAAFNDMKSHYPISRDQERIDQLRRVGERLQRAIPWWDMPGSDADDAGWEFVVFDVPGEINAFAMAGGKVGVFTGLFKVVQNDDQLASVLAHEIAHVTAKHVQERLSRDLAKDTVGIVASPIMLVQQAAGASGDLAFDRDKEREADHIGMIYMSRAGYNPQEAINVLERLELVTGGMSVKDTLQSNHPSTPERIQRLQDELPKALEIYRQSGVEVAPTVIK
ncbi:MAG TPA: M48 family metallopeptidase [Opitutaceae bacterium]|nr:M48 family metallopeptidase [Opitutaceae bacterium]